MKLLDSRIKQHTQGETHRGKHTEGKLEITGDENQGNPFELITPESITFSPPITTDHHFNTSIIKIAAQNYSLLRSQVFDEAAGGEGCEGRCGRIKVKS